jgi:LacI family transcriptional regulator
MATIHDVAKRAGVAPITVSRVINDSGYVSHAMRERVNAAIQEMGYVPNVLARSLKSKRTNTIALIFTDITNPFFNILARGVEDTAHEAGFNVFFCNTDEDQEKENTYIQLVLQKQVDGILLVPASINSRSVEMIQGQDTPLVVVDRRFPPGTVDIVRGDSFGGAFQLTELLIHLGHRNISILSGPIEVTTAEDRMQGYRKAMKEHGLEAYIDCYYGRFTQQSGRELTHQLFTHQQKPTAILAANNLIAIGTLAACDEMGLKVPEDVTVVSFDEIPETLTPTPFLTVVSQPPYAMGKKAAEILIARIKKDPDTMDHFQEIVFPVDLKKRASSGPPLQH